MPKAQGNAAIRAADVKRKWRIEQVVAGYAVHLTPVSGGRRLTGLCPFHSEDHASFMVYPETQSFYCFGCHASGDVISFVSKMEHVGFTAALRLLGETSASPHTHRPTASAPGSRSLPRDPGGTASRAVSITGTRAGDALSPGTVWLHETVLTVATALGTQGLTRAPEAASYLGERGISLALARRCRLGYLHDNALLDFLAGDPHLQQIARQVGLVNRWHRGTLARRLLVPEVRDGRVVQLIGRVVPGVDAPLPNLKYYLICAHGDKGLLGYGAALDRLGASDAHVGPPLESQNPAGIHTPAAPIVRADSKVKLRGILVLEGALDYVVAVGWDLPVLPVALLGTYPCRRQLSELLDLQRRSDDLPLLLMEDADPAGQEATALLARRLTELGARFVVVPPLTRVPASSSPYKDLGELAPLGRIGRTQVLLGLASALTTVAKPDRHTPPDDTPPDCA